LGSQTLSSSCSAHRQPEVFFFGAYLQAFGSLQLLP
jgi:hypothetical protein